MLESVMYKYDPEDFNEIWFNITDNGKKYELFNKDTYESIEDAKKDYLAELKDYELEEAYMAENCKYILYNDHTYPAGYDAHTKKFYGIGLINNMQFTKKEIHYWSAEEPMYQDY